MKTNMHVAWYPEPLPQAYREFVTVMWRDVRGPRLLTVGAPPAYFDLMTLDEQAEAIGDAISKALRLGASGGRITEFQSPSTSL
jgi:hypothetical protein